MACAHGVGVCIDLALVRSVHFKGDLAFPALAVPQAVTFISACRSETSSPHWLQALRLKKKKS